MSAASRLGILVLLAGALLFAGLGRMALTDRDEGVNAAAAREMLERGSWITPTFNEAPRFQKPALVYWLMAAGYATLGASETTARLPSAIAAALLVLIQYVMARWLFGPAAAFRAALVLLTSLEFVVIARMALTDAMLTLWTTSAGYAFFRAHHGPGSTGRWYGAMYAALALAFLTKGPVGVVVPIAGIALYLAIAGGFARAVREARPAWGLGLFLLVAGPWYSAMLWEHGGDYLARARHETLGRVVRTVTGPGGTMLFYVPVVLLGFFPWSAFLPGALIAALREARARAARDRAGAALVFAAAWVLAVLGLFSLFQSRLPHYIAPLFPAAALLVAGAWPARVPSMARALLAGIGLLVGIGLVAAWAGGPAVGRLLAPAYPATPDAALPSSVAAVGLLALGIAAAACVGDGARAFPALAVLTLGVLGVGLHVALPAFSAEFVTPPGALVRRALPSLRPCDTLVAFGPDRPSLVFYGGRPVTFVRVRDQARLAALAARADRIVVVAPRSFVGQLPPALAALPTLDAERGYVLLGRPLPERPCLPGETVDRPSPR